MDTLKELRNINKSFKKLKEKNDIESLINITEDSTEDNDISKKSNNALDEISEEDKIDEKVKSGEAITTNKSDEKNKSQLILLEDKDGYSNLQKENEYKEKDKVKSKNKESYDDNGNDNKLVVLENKNKKDDIIKNEKGQLKDNYSNKSSKSINKSIGSESENNSKLPLSKRIQTKNSVNSMEKLKTPINHMDTDDTDSIEVNVIKKEKSSQTKILSKSGISKSSEIGMKKDNAKTEEKEKKPLRPEGKTGTTFSSKSKLEKVKNSSDIMISSPSPNALTKLSKTSSIRNAIDSKFKENSAAKESLQNKSRGFNKKDILRKRMYNEKLKVGNNSEIKTLSKDKDNLLAKKNDIKNEIKNKKDHSHYKSSIANNMKKENNLIKISNDKLSTTSSMISKEGPKKLNNVTKKDITKVSKINKEKDSSTNEKNQDSSGNENKEKTIEAIDAKILSIEKEMNKLDSNNSNNNIDDSHEAKKDSEFGKKKKEKGKSTDNKNSSVESSNENIENEKKERIKEKSKEEREQEEKKDKSEMSCTKKNNKNHFEDSMHMINKLIVKEEEENVKELSLRMVKCDSTEYNIDNKDKVILDSYKNLGKPLLSNDNNGSNNKEPGNPEKMFNSEIILPSLVDIYGKGLHENLIVNKSPKKTNEEDPMNRKDESYSDNNNNLLTSTTTSAPSTSTNFITNSNMDKREAVTKITNDYSIGVNGNLNLFNSNDDLGTYSSNSPTNMVADQTSKRIDRILDYLKSVGNTSSFDVMSDTKSEYDGTVVNSKVSDTASM